MTPPPPPGGGRGGRRQSLDARLCGAAEEILRSLARGRGVTEAALVEALLDGLASADPAGSSVWRVAPWRPTEDAAGDGHNG
jgi:hypothetical protein